MDRLGTGDPGLDRILGGGLPATGTYLLSGAPGTGKTMLAQQIMFRNATDENRAVFIATLAEPLDKTLRYGQEMTFFDKSAVGGRVVYETLADASVDGGLKGAQERILALLDRYQPGVLVLDSLRALRPFGQDQREYRVFIAELAARLAVRPVTALLAGDYGHEDVLDEPAFAVADGIILLRTNHVGSRTLRALEVAKLRGSEFLSGEHGYRIGKDGLRAFTRLADAVDLTPPMPTGERVSLGSAGLDAMLDGGVFTGTSTLITGPSGSGKTMLGLGFLSAAVRRGERAILATLQEGRTQLARALSPALQDDDRLSVLHHSPVDVYIDEWTDDLLQHIEREGASVLFVDSASDLRLAAVDATRFEEYVYSFVQRCSRRGITTLLSFETPALVAPPTMMTMTVSHIADNVIALGYREDGDRLRRVVCVVKSRASGHDQRVRTLDITRNGVEVGEPVEFAPSGIARGIPD